jgi:hypothetical protein
VIEPWSRYQETYERMQRRVQALQEWVDDYADPSRCAVLKPSAQKKNSLWGFATTNLCVHQVSTTPLHGTTVDEALQPAAAKPSTAAAQQVVTAVTAAPDAVTITAGCAAAICLGFKGGGTRQLSERCDELENRAINMLADEKELAATAVAGSEWQVNERAKKFWAGMNDKLRTGVWRVKSADGSMVAVVHLTQTLDRVEVTIHLDEHLAVQDDPQTHHTSFDIDTNMKIFIFERQSVGAFATGGGSPRGRSSTAGLPDGDLALHHGVWHLHMRGEEQPDWLSME